MNVRLLLLIATFTVSLFPLVSQAALVDHEFFLSLSYSGGPSLAIPPKIRGIEVTAPTYADGGPLYEGQTTVIENPLYDLAADPGSIQSIESVAITFDLTKSSLISNNIVHRDIATRNVLITTNSGTYESAASGHYFMNEGPLDLRTNIGPVRWMAPESLRAMPTTGGNDYWDLSAGSYFLVSYSVPEPSTAISGLFLFSGLLWWRCR